MNLCIVGCTHGNFELIYSQVAHFESVSGKHIDVVLACGDMQTIRNKDDLPFLSIPEKFKHNLCGDFHKYYNKKLVAPKLTIFIGGNHESSKYLREKIFGGFVAENIYFMGYSGVLDLVKGETKIRISGASGIFKFFDFSKGYHPCLDLSNLSSEYHLRDFEILKLLLFDQLVRDGQCSWVKSFSKEPVKIEPKLPEEKEEYKEPIPELIPELIPEEKIEITKIEDESLTPDLKKDSQEKTDWIERKHNMAIKIMMTHDWPSLIFQGPQKSQILSNKPYFEKDIYKNFIGNKGGDILLSLTEPHLYFSGHYHYYLESTLYHNSKNKQLLLEKNNLKILNQR